MGAFHGVPVMDNRNGHAWVGDCFYDNDFTMDELSNEFSYNALAIGVGYILK
jgi:hypothetical protein